MARVYHAILEGTARHREVCVDASELDRFILDTVEADPQPPREIDRGALLVHCTLNLPSAVMLGTGVVVLLIVAEFSFTGRLAPGQDSPISMFHLVMGGLGLGLAVLPFLTYLRFATVLRTGVLTTARIVEVEPAEAPGAPPAAAAGAAAAAARVVGTRIVDHHLGPFEERFSSDAAWSEVLVPGIDVGVLVHPYKPQVLRDLHPVR
jgi:hypothetical protein